VRGCEGARVRGCEEGRVWVHHSPALKSLLWRLSEAVRSRAEMLARLAFMSRAGSATSHRRIAELQPSCLRYGDMAGDMTPRMRWHITAHGGGDGERNRAGRCAPSSSGKMPLCPSKQAHAHDHSRGLY
jgi:hypothetical protein